MRRSFFASCALVVALLAVNALSQEKEPRRTARIDDDAPAPPFRHSANLNSAATRPARTGVDVFPAEATDDLRERLRTVLDRVEYKQISFDEAVAQLRKAAGVNLVVDYRSLVPHGIESRSKVDISLNKVTLAETLKVLLLSISTPNTTMSYEAKGNIVRIYASDDNESVSLVFRIYDIQDLLVAERARWTTFHPLQPASRPAGSELMLEPPPYWSHTETEEALMKLIMETIAADTWKPTGGIRHISAFNGRLIIEQTTEMHEKVESFLAAMRATSKSQKP